MKFIKNNKGAILFYTIILLATFIISIDVKRDNTNEESKYVMVSYEK